MREYRYIGLLLLFLGFFSGTINGQVISTVAGTGSAGYSGDGGAATAATLNNPHGIVLDNAGNIIIADYLNNVIRKLNAAGTIVLVAGNDSAGFAGDGGAATAAQLYFPGGVAV